MSDLFIELGTEELPPKALQNLASAFAQGLYDGLTEQGLMPADCTVYATPRRLGVLLDNVPEGQSEQHIEKRGPALKAAFDAEGKPSKAAQGFARSCGVEVSQLEQRETDKGTWLYYQTTEAGKSLQDVLQGLLQQVLDRLPIPKRMRWGAGETEFVRPIHWLVVMYNEIVLPVQVYGQTASNITYGHRFHAPGPIELKHACAYVDQLTQSGHVMPYFNGRREQIRDLAEATAKEFGGQLKISDELLDEVTALVEWPVPVCGSFDEEFLQVPAEALVTTMQDNQKYFALYGSDGALLPYFITIANIESRDVDKVRSGNERVIRPRFADARFFWEQDRKQPLASRRAALDKVVYQQKLGSIGDKVSRVARLASWLAPQLQADSAQAQRAAELCKCDLLTEMVGEFPKLQGIMGRYYAEHDGEPAAVCSAIEEHYWPRQAGDNLPQSAEAQTLALADRIDTLLGIFSIGQKPTGDKDPFGLRRAALGVIRILIEKKLTVDLRELLRHAADGYAADIQASEALDAVLDYVLERLRAYYEDQGIAYDSIDAVLALRPTQLADFDARLQAVNRFRSLDAAAALAAANKRIQNILRKAEDTATQQPVDQALLQEAAEKALNQQLQALLPQLQTMRDYGERLQALAQLRTAVDEFFDHVMVNADDAAIRNNRLALLRELSQQFLQVADISLLQH